MRILFVLENYFPNIGGVETLFKTLVEQLDEKGHQITLITTKLEKEHPSKEVLGNITILRYPFPNRYFFTFLSFFPIAWHARNCDLIHTTSYNAGLPAYFGAKLSRKKIVITFHEVWGQLWFKLPYMGKAVLKGHYYFEQFLLKLKFDRFIAVSESTAENLKNEGVDPSRVVVNYNGINYKEFDTTPLSKAENAPFTYTYFGRLGISKGLDLLLQAAVVVKEKMPNSRLKMILPTTPAGFLQDIKDQIQRNNLTEYIQILHELPFSTLQLELKKSDCVVVPSYSEGFCFAAVEAIALGVPIISSDQMALREVVSGQFIKMKTFDVDGLVEAILAAGFDQWEETPVRKFELKENTKNYIDIYRNLLGLTTVDGDIVKS